LNQKNKGFTLIELVVVIVILGVLASTVAPKFIDLTSDAKVASMQGFRASIEASSNMFRAKYIISGKSSTETNIKFNNTGSNIRVANGYLSHRGTISPQYSTGSTTYALGVINYVDYELDITITYTGATATFSLDDNANCTITYTDSVAKNTAPVISENLIDCT
jgi:MSHA pilin protein MshA